MLLQFRWDFLMGFVYHFFFPQWPLKSKTKQNNSFRENLFFFFFS